MPRKSQFPNSRFTSLSDTVSDSIYTLSEETGVSESSIIRRCVDLALPQIMADAQINFINSRRPHLPGYQSRTRVLTPSESDDPDWD